MDDSKLAGNPQIIVLSGPSGVGKDAVISKMREKGSTCHFAITTTTRKIRKGEVHGRDYFFVTKDLMGKVKDSCIYPKVMGSDHCPIGLDIKT